MANYVEYIQAGTGEAWPVRDAEAHSTIEDLRDRTEAAENTLTEIQNLVHQEGDYVVEQGTATSTSGTWSYRKWNSGVCEAWANLVDIPISGATTSVGLYAGWGSVYYPSDLFVTIDTINYSTYVTSGYDFSGKVVMEGITHFNFYVVSFTAFTTNNLARVYPHVIGTWK